MSLGISAPAAVPVELRADQRRVFRLSAEIGQGGLRLERPAPFEPGRPVTIRFSLPGAAQAYEAEAEVATTGDPLEEGGSLGGTALYFREPLPEAQAAISAYLMDRLGLPPLP